MPLCLNCKIETYVLDPVTRLCAACQHFVEEGAAEDAAETGRIILTTETAHNLSIDQRLDIVSAECVIGLHLFKDVAVALRDTFGGRSNVMQAGLRDARKTTLIELRREAVALGADAVVGVALHYNEVSGGGKNMLLLVASGTAVTLTDQ
jgi:uncharacterized protein YbjQ (UPF0145 family)